MLSRHWAGIEQVRKGAHASRKTIFVFNKMTYAKPVPCQANDAVSSPAKELNGARLTLGCKSPKAATQRVQQFIGLQHPRSLSAKRMGATIGLWGTEVGSPPNTQLQK
jgi:hypothetical protein